MNNYDRNEKSKILSTLGIVPTMSSPPGTSTHSSSSSSSFFPVEMTTATTIGAANRGVENGMGGTSRSAEFASLSSYRHTGRSSGSIHSDASASFEGIDVSAMESMEDEQPERKRSFSDASSRHIQSAANAVVASSFSTISDLKAMASSVRASKVRSASFQIVNNVNVTTARPKFPLRLGILNSIDSDDHERSESPASVFSDSNTPRLGSGAMSSPRGYQAMKAFFASDNALSSVSEHGEAGSSSDTIDVESQVIYSQLFYALLSLANETDNDICFVYCSS
jgi:hypothetical protein